MSTHNQSNCRNNYIEKIMKLMLDEKYDVWYQVFYICMKLTIKKWEWNYTGSISIVMFKKLGEKWFETWVHP